MKKSSLLFALLALLNLNVFSQGLNDVYSSGGFVFAVGSNGITLRSTNTGGVYSSTNVGSADLHSVYSVANNVWSVGNGGAFNISTDNGSTWSSSNVSSLDLKTVFFIDSLTGFIAGGNGVMLKSIDGGNNWVSLSSGTSNDLYKVKFINSNTGFACGANGTILKTTDGGNAWLQLSLPVSTAIYSFDALNDLVIAGTENSTIIISNDLGQSWTSATLRIYSRPKINCINITAQNSFLVTFESGSIWYSTNRGATFNYSLLPFLDELNSVTIGSSGRAYAVSKNHVIVIRSINNGVNWQLPSNATYSISFQEVLPFQGLSFNKIFNINYQKRGVVYACQRYNLYRSLNAGLNWSQISTLPFNYACQQLLVSMKDSTKMIVVLNKQSIDTGIVYRTSNYGLNWSKVYQGRWDYIGNLITQDPQHPDTVYLGANDSVMRSTDFGLSWIKIAEYPFNDFCDIAVHTSNSEVLYVSTNGFPARMHKSTNGGYNWFMIDFVADTNFSEMPAIAVSNLNPNIVFHAQLGGGALQTGLKRSYSQGSTWLFNQFAGFSWSVDIAKDDPNVFAYGNVSLSTVYLSTNGGVNFIGTPNDWAESIFYYDRANLFITNGSEVSKMMVTYNMPIGIRPISSNVPVKFNLYQNYPNPFNPFTNIKFDVAGETNLKLIIYDVLGREIETLVNEKLKAGEYRVNWNGMDYPSGVYFYKFQAGEYAETKKMVLVK